jgi:hypothetical protein
MRICSGHWQVLPYGPLDIVCDILCNAVNGKFAIEWRREGHPTFSTVCFCIASCAITMSVLDADMEVRGRGCETHRLQWLLFACPHSAFGVRRMKELKSIRPSKSCHTMSADLICAAQISARLFRVARIQQYIRASAARSRSLPSRRP